MTREILDGIFSVVRTGCQWRQLPHEFAPWPRVYWWFRRFRLDGTRIYLNTALRERARRAVGRDPRPSAAILDSRPALPTDRTPRGRPGVHRHRQAVDRGTPGLEGRGGAASTPFGQSRRLSKDYEKLCSTSEAMIYAAMSRLMLRRLARH